MFRVGCERQVVWIHTHIGDKTREADFILSQVLKTRKQKVFQLEFGGIFVVPL